jgi:hypothetical protein
MSIFICCLQVFASEEGRLSHLAVASQKASCTPNLHDFKVSADVFVQLDPVVFADAILEGGGVVGVEL